MTVNHQTNVDSLKASISIRSLFEADGHQIKQMGRYTKVNCPFHRERTPSCFIYDPTHFCCYACGSRGDVFNYVMLRDGCDFRTALATLSGGNKLGIRPSTCAQRRVALNKQTAEYLPPEYFSNLMASWGNQTDAEEVVMLGEALQVDPAALFRLGVAWAEEHSSWAIPMRNAKREIIGIRLRDNTGKKWAVKGSRNGLFIPSGEPVRDVVVTEGPTDCAAVLSMGVFAIGKPMAMMSNEEVMSFIKTLPIKRVIVIPDNDAPGLKGAQKLIDVCKYPTCEMVLPTKDVREFAKMGGNRTLFDSVLRNQNWRNL